MEEKTISVLDSRSLRNVFGTCDEHLRTIRKALGIQVILDGDEIMIRSSDPDSTRRGAYLLEQLQQLAYREGGILSPDDISRALSEAMCDEEISQVDPLEVFKGRLIRPKTAGQAKYVELLRQKEIVFCTGPAGTGKTYLAVARAVEALRTEGKRKIVLVRPAVEAGESLGFLPGDLQAKINPYLRPLFDALADMLDHDILQRYMSEDRVEVIPLAYMRGRTINRACIILDEAQNTTVSQMKMFLTRMGENSRIVVCGDPTQIDLPSHKRSGLSDALIRLKNIPGIGRIALGDRDIVRHNLVQQIVNAYEADKKNEEESNFVSEQ
ncbi:MAG: PhoH family protein [Planctomycetia bacterium]|nr:PhoH family protein [Planctomycetia bacterium]